MLLDATDWATSEFQGAPNLDKRLRDRLVLTAADSPPDPSPTPQPLAD